MIAVGSDSDDADRPEQGLIDRLLPEAVDDASTDRVQDMTPSRRQVLKGAGGAVAGILGTGTAATVDAVKYGIIYSETTGNHPYELYGDLFLGLYADTVGSDYTEFLTPRNDRVADVAAESKLAADSFYGTPTGLDMPQDHIEADDWQQYGLRNLEKPVPPEDYFQGEWAGDCEDYAFARGSVLLRWGHPVRLVAGITKHYEDTSFSMELARALTEDPKDEGSAVNSTANTTASTDDTRPRRPRATPPADPPEVGPALDQVLQELEGHVILETKIDGTYYVTDTFAPDELRTRSAYREEMEYWEPIGMSGQDPDGTTYGVKEFDPDW